MAVFLFLRHLIPPCKRGHTIRRRKSVPEQPPGMKEMRVTSASLSPATLLFFFFSLRLTFTFSPPFCFFLLTFARAFHFHLFVSSPSAPRDSRPPNPPHPRLSCASAATAINIHPSTIYFDNAILICTSTFARSSYDHLSCP